MNLCELHRKPELAQVLLDIATLNEGSWARRKLSAEHLVKELAELSRGKP
jgi:hypothetical protein